MCFEVVRETQLAVILSITLHVALILISKKKRIAIH